MIDMISILTGDIIRSTKIDNIELLIDTLYLAFKEVNNTILDGKASFEIYRGDSFQVKLNNPEKALITAILLKSKLRSATPDGAKFSSVGEKENKKIIGHVPLHLIWDARISIGIGTTDYLPSKLKESSGQAFTFSGRGLDQLKMEGHTLKIQTPWSEFNEEFDVTAKLVDAMMQKWSVYSAEAIYLTYLKNITQKDLAVELNKSQPAIHKRLINANSSEIGLVIKRFEYLIKKRLYD